MRAMEGQVPDNMGRSETIHRAISPQRYPADRSFADIIFEHRNYAGWHAHHVQFAVGFVTELSSKIARSARRFALRRFD